MADEQQLIPDSPNTWDSGRYDWPASAQPSAPVQAQAAGPERSMVPAPIVRRAKAIWLYFIAVGALAVVSVLSVIGILILAGLQRTVPGELTTLAATALGGLVAMVAVTQVGSGDGQ